MAEVVGVSASFIRHLAERAAPDMTTADVCSTIVKPDTQKLQCAYVELLEGKTDQEGKTYLGKATCFVSHAWSYNFNTPVSAMLEYAESHPDAYFWFDLFTNNQHLAVLNDHVWWTTNFRKSIESIGSVLLVLSPWNNPIPITRAWCLFEIMCAVLAKERGVSLHVVLPSSERAALRSGIQQSFQSIINALIQIDGVKATACNKHDLQCIFDAIRSTVGFSRLNMEVKDALRAWYATTAADIAEELLLRGQQDVAPELSPESTTYLLNVGRALISLGKSERAFQFIMPAVHSLIQLYGEQNIAVAESFVFAGSAKLGSGQYLEGKEHAERALSIATQVAGDRHVICGRALGVIGCSFKLRGEYSNALSPLERALEILKEHSKDGASDEMVSDMAEAYCDLGGLFIKLNRFEDGLNAINAAIAIQEPLLGDHPSVASLYCSVGLALKETGKHEAALEAYGKALKIDCAVVGELHPSVGVILNNIAGAHYALGDYDAALVSYKKSLDVKVATVGPDHPGTATSHINIGVSYSKRGSFEKAIEHLQRASDILQKNTNAPKQSLATVYHNLALCVDAKGLYQSAVDYFLKAIDIYKATCGEKHLTTAKSQVRLAAVYSKMGRFDDAFACCSDCLATRSALCKPTHELMAEVLSTIASTAFAAGDIARAVAEYESALAIQVAALGEAHLDTGVMQAGFALALSAKGDSTRAVSLCSAASKTAQAKGLIVNTYPEIGAIFHACGMVYLQAGIFQAARDSFCAALKQREALYGYEHEDYIASQEGLKMCDVSNISPDDPRHRALTIRASRLLTGIPALKHEIISPLEAATAQANTPPSQADSAKSFEGWLVKQGQIIRSWRRRYCTLDADGRLKYYPSEKRERVCGEFLCESFGTSGPLLSRTWPAASAPGARFAFISSDRVYYAFADDDAAARSWKNALRQLQHIKEHK